MKISNKHKKSKLCTNEKLNKELKNKTVLITGGAGSIGSHLAREILKYNVKAIRVLDIDEHALFRLNRSLNDSRLRPLLGNILDMDRVEMACVGVDIIIHMAAIKNIEVSEFNPIETIDSNVNGTVNMIKIAIRNKPCKFLNVSSDKAVEPSTLYGITKMLSEKLVKWAGVHITTTKFSSVRVGNVVETRGNVFEVWNKETKDNLPLSITHPSMKRYFFHIDDAVSFILQCLPLTNKGEIFVPKMKLYNITDLASHISKNYRIIGKRTGEKIEEKLITNDEKKKAKETKHMWIIK